MTAIASVFSLFYASLEEFSKIPETATFYFAMIRVKKNWMSNKGFRKKQNIKKAVPVSAEAFINTNGCFCNNAN